MEEDCKTVIADLTQQITILKGASRQSNLIRKRLQDAFTVLKEKDSELKKSKQRTENDLNLLEKMQEELVEKEKMAALGSLVAGVAHEVNTPIGVAITSNSFYESEIKKLKQLYETGELSEEDMEMFLETAIESSQIVQKSLVQAASLIRSFKQISVDLNIDDMRRIDISAYIHDIIRTFKNQFKKTRIQIDIDCPDGLIIDTYPGSISQIFNNLFINVLKHAYGPDESGKVFIHIRFGNDNLLHILFEDDGAGMDPEMSKQAFDPFVTTGRDKGGSGLGLNIVYNLIVHRFHGDIRLESEKDAGCKFFIKLPIEPAGI